MDYIIATSSTSDLPRTWLEEHQIPFIPYSYTVGRPCARTIAGRRPGPPFTGGCGKEIC